MPLPSDLPPAGIDRLLAIMAALRDPQTGCPWDLEQTFATIAPYTLEEAHEVADAIDRQAWDELKGELGDLLFQAVYHAQMAAEAAGRRAMEHGMKRVDVFVKGPGSGRETAIRSLGALGLEIGPIADVTPVPHNGCRPPKRRRVWARE